MLSLLRKFWQYGELSARNCTGRPNIHYIYIYIYTRYISYKSLYCHPCWWWIPNPKWCEMAEHTAVLDMGQISLLVTCAHNLGEDTACQAGPQRGCSWEQTQQSGAVGYRFCSIKMRCFWFPWSVRTVWPTSWKPNPIRLKTGVQLTWLMEELARQGPFCTGCGHYLVKPGELTVRFLGPCLFQIC